MQIIDFFNKKRPNINRITDRTTVNTDTNTGKQSTAKTKFSLIVWLGLCFFGLSAIILIIMWMFQTIFFGSFYKAIKTKNLTTCAKSIETNVDSIEINNLIDMIGEQNDINIMLCAHDVYGNYNQIHSVFVDSSSSIKSLETNDLNSYFIKARNNQGTVITIISNKPSDSIHFESTDGENAEKQNDTFIGSEPIFEKNETESLIYANVFFDNSDKEYLLLFDARISPTESTVQTLKYQLRIITFTLIVTVIILSTIFSKLIANPIENINNSAKELAEGNYDVVFNGKGYKEVEQLSETLNYATSELSQVDQMRKDLIANVSHDLRTPLTLITGYGEVMRDIPGENTAENIQIIIDEATRLSSLVSDLIDISKSEAGTMKLEASTFCITKTIEEMFVRYNKLKEQDGYTFEFEHDKDVYVYADELKISQVVYNLVNNAVNYSGESKAIKVRQSCYDNRVRIEVIDSGPGIPPDKLKNIWDRYYKVDKSHKSAKIGTGLGLSIVKTVLKLHKAQFGVFSTLGKGTTFWFELYRTNKDGEPLQ